jgi:hypothetical protein
MRIIFGIVAAGLMCAGGALANPQRPASEMSGPACLQAPLVDHTHVANPSTVLFYMKDGKIWQNNLAAACSGLKFHGFKIVGHQNELCAGSGISVIVTGEVCQLGKFSPYAAPAKSAP